MNINTAQKNSGPTLLSLKNIYRLLFSPDYMLPLTQVIPKAMRSGYTVVRFWRDMLLPEARGNENNVQLWEEGEKRSRYLSDLLNRTRVQTFYSDYFMDLEQRIDPVFLSAITERFADFLIRHDFSYAVLKEKLANYIKAFACADTAVAPEAAEYFVSQLELAGEYERIGKHGKVFYGAAMLTLLSVYALFGAHMDNAALARLRLTGECGLDKMWKASIEGRKAPVILTNRNSELCRPPLASELFVGRDKEVGEVLELLLAGGKVMITGLGGIGKTELLRQVILRLRAQGVYKRFAFVQYEGTLANSFYNAFSSLHGDTEDAWVNEVRGILENRDEGPTLLLIDNLECVWDKDPALKMLSSYDVDICLTSRISGLIDFAVYPLAPLEDEMAGKLFKQAYRFPIDERAEAGSERAVLQYASGHPLLLRLLGSLAHAKHWSMGQLTEELMTRGFALSFVQDAVKTNISEICRQLFDFSDLKPCQLKLLRLFALMPYQTVSVERLSCLAGDVCQDPDLLADELEMLFSLGWLDTNRNGYVMHPVIAQTLRLTPIEPEEHPLFWRYLISSLTAVDSFVRKADEVNVKTAYHALMLCGTIPEDFQKLVQCVLSSLKPMGSEDMVNHLLRHYVACVSARRPVKPEEELLLCCLEADYDASTNPQNAIRAARDIIFLLGRHPFSDSLRYQAMVGAMQAIALQNVPLEWHEAFEREMEITDHIHMNNLNEAEYLSAKVGYEMACIENMHLALDDANAAMKILISEKAEKSYYAFQLYGYRIGIYAHLFEIDRAEEDFQKALALLQYWYPIRHNENFGALYSNMATMYQSVGNNTKALSYYFMILDEYEKNHIIYPRHQAILYGNIAVGYYRLNDYAHSIEYHRKSIRLLQQETGDKSVDIGRAYNNLARVYIVQGELENAVSYLKMALNIAKETAGCTSQLYAEVNYSLGQAYADMKETELSIQALTIACPLMESLYGAEHPRTQSAKTLFFEQKDIKAKGENRCEG